MLAAFLTKNIHASWLPILNQAAQRLNPIYIQTLINSSDWLPGKEAIFNAFSLPLNKTRYILFGESPYPRPASANGYAFWDAAVNSLWAPTGLSTAVNRATSLRNIMKMLLVSRNDLSLKDTSQSAIAKLDKSLYIQTGQELFTNFLSEGFLLLNTSLVFRSAKQVKEDAANWYPFIDALLGELSDYSIKLILFGKIAEAIQRLKNTAHFSHLIVEHPYNLSFISNQTVLSFFKPLDLLSKK